MYFSTITMWVKLTLLHINNRKSLYRGGHMSRFDCIHVQCFVKFNSRLQISRSLEKLHVNTNFV